MLLSGGISSSLLRSFPDIEPVLRYIGAVYILYLAFSILKASYGFTEKDAEPVGFVHGLTLQALNPKLFVYAFTVFTAFLASLASNVGVVVMVALVLAAISFASTSVWALFGTVIKTYLRNPRLITIINILLSLSLVYTALALTGLV